MGDGVRKALDHHDESQRGAIEDEERGSGQRGQAVGLGDGQILGHDLAQHHMEKADCEEGDKEAESVKKFRGDRRVPGRQQPGENAINRVFARPSQAETGKGHTYLGHRKQAPGIGQEVERRLRAGIALRGHLAQPGMPHRKQRHLGAREEAVDGDEQNDDQQANGSIGHRP